MTRRNIDPRVAYYQQGQIELAHPFLLKAVEIDTQLLHYSPTIARPARLANAIEEGHRAGRAV